MVISYHLQHLLEIDMEVGDSAPDFELDANDGTNVNLKSFAGKNNVVLCFYPKNHLFACPSKKVFDMAKSVISVYDEILATNSKLFAISIDTVESQKKFVEEYSIPYLHLSDTQKDTCKKYPGTNIAGLAKRQEWNNQKHFPGYRCEKSRKTDCRIFKKIIVVLVL